jgi:hypothetical protein
MYPWRSLGTLLPLILGILGFLTWVVYSYYYCKNPMIPLVVLKDRTAAISYFGTVIQGLAVCIFGAFRIITLLISITSNSDFSTICHYFIKP